jgi:transcriptional regulator with XRE-family HTH domain
VQQIVGQNIKARRLALGMNQLQLSEAMFRHAERSSYISLVEAGKANLRLSRLVEFAEKLSCQPYELLLVENRNAKEDTNE